MLIVNPTQIDVLERFVLREHYPFWNQRLKARLPSIEEDELLARIEKALARARALGIEQISDLTTYLDLCGRLGFDFESRADCARIASLLSDTRVSRPSRRLQLALEHCERIARIREHNQHTRDAFERR
jgi:hypothetical protein